MHQKRTLSTANYVRLGLAASWLMACSPADPGGDATGGAPSTTGGTTSTTGGTRGGLPSTGGITSTGGLPSTGGVTSTGGLPSTGGVTSTGGLPSTGGTFSTGGIVNTGGLPSTGGIASTGGTFTTGGVTSTGGTGPGGGQGGTAGKGAGGSFGGGNTTGGKASSGGTTGTGGASATGGTNAGGGPTYGSGPERTMGYIGCSMSQNVAAGYATLGGKRLWPSMGAYGGMVVQNWAMDGGPWTAANGFDAGVRQYGQPEAVWIMLCIFSNMVTYEETKAIIALAKKHAPNAKLYITGQPLNTGTDCNLAGNGGAAKTDAMAKQAGEDTSLGVTYAGTFGPLTVAQRSDGCHANAEGQRLLGQQVIDKWGK